MKIGVLASGGGSNLQSILDACRDGSLAGEVVLIISNNSKAGAFERARSHAVPCLHLSALTHPVAEELDSAILSSLEARGVEYVALAGYMKKLGPKTLKRYRNRTVNIHPALLPDFGGKGMYGMNVHRAVIISEAVESGPTVHVVDANYDEGPILAQTAVPVMPDDSAETLQKRVLEAEHRIYPQTLNALAQGLIKIYSDPPVTIIRPVTLERDFEQAADVVRRGFRTPAARFGLTRENCPTHPSFADSTRLRRITDAGGTFFCGYQSGVMNGCVGVEPSRDDEGTWYIEKLAVPPEARSAGLGSLLLEHGCRAASTYGGRKVSVGLIDQDEDLKAWYEERGFSRIRTQEFDNLPFTVCFMARDVDQIE